MSRSSEKSAYAFIDAQNVYKGTQSEGWTVDWAKFRIYLTDKYKVDKAYIFIGYMSKYQNLYSMLQESGYIIIFKPILTYKDGTVKGNVDAELIVECWRREKEYCSAILVTGDGDFAPAVDYLKELGKFGRVIAPNHKYSSSLLRKSAGKDIMFMNQIKGKIGRKKGSKK